MFQGASKFAPPPGSTGEAILILLEQLQRLVPKHVPWGPSLTYANIVGLVVLLLALPLVYSSYRGSVTYADHVQTMGMLTGSLVLGVLLRDMVFRYIYGRAMFVANEEHYTLISWLPRYLAALSPPLVA